MNVTRLLEIFIVLSKQSFLMFLFHKVS